MAAEACLKNARILVVEDEFFLADDLARSLHDAGAATLGPVATTEEAEELVRRHKVDGAIVDLNLRGKTAFEFVARLAGTDIPCVIVSGYGEDAVPEDIRAFKRLEKPVSPAAVMRALEGELERCT